MGPGPFYACSILDAANSEVNPTEKSFVLAPTPAFDNPRILIMKHMCLLCSRTSLDGNLWCQEKACSSAQKIVLFDSGEWLGEIEIIKILAVLPAAVVYVGKRSGETIMLKVAHENFQDKLKREAHLLFQTNQERVHHSMLPVLKPAYSQATLAEHPYGKTVIGSQTRYYLVLQYSEGDLLHNTLLKNPQPWYQHVGWLMISLADALAYLHQLGKLHCCLHPEMILVRCDKQGIPRPLLLDLGIACKNTEVPEHWNRRYTLPAYTAPELITRDNLPDSTTDVYGLGLLLYEMLAGHAAFEHTLQREDQVYKNVLKAAPEKINRSDLTTIPEIAELAIQKIPARRQVDILTFAQQLSALFPPVPKEKVGRKIDWRLLAIFTGALMAISLLLVAAVLWAEAA
jgi:serine/threonine protein kinase